MEKTNAWVLVLGTYVVGVLLFFGTWKLSDILFFQ